MLHNKLELLYYPNKILISKANTIDIIDECLKEVAKKMLELLYEHHGVGLAANQIGLLQRILVLDLQEDDQRLPTIIINPIILDSSKETESAEEGCLSLPGVILEIERCKNIQVKFQDIEGTERTEEYQDLNARCIQHEIDHLNGVLIWDRVSRIKKELALNTYKKALKDKME